MTAQQPAQKQIQYRSEIPFWRDERVLNIAAQVVSAVFVIGLIVWVISNVVSAANERGLSLGFRFLREAAGFPIGETAIPYDPSRSFAYAFLVGVLGTLRVAFLGIILATILGTLVGLARLSSNWLIRRLAIAYIEIHRNIPLLVLLFLWYRGVFLQFPRVKDSITWPGPIYINQRGLYLTWPRLTSSGTIFAILSIIGLVFAVVAWVWLRKIREATGRQTFYTPISLAILILFPLTGWFLAGSTPITLEVPVLSGFNFKGGVHLSPEFTALLVGLVTYTAGFIAEVVRAGIQAVGRGQLEAARAVGLNYRQVLSLVIFPQALRVIIPPLISQYLNLTKNSSLAFFIGYPELFFIGKTTINQAGRAIQVFLLIMAVYLTISLFTSLVLNIYNRRIQFVER
ncbi:MAG: ABC transporter permease subunit [Anaerolineales bacterium]|jgi:general L-amino acid transport system permease protein